MNRKKTTTHDHPENILIGKQASLLLCALVIGLQVTQAENLMSIYHQAREHDAVYKQALQKWEAAKLAVPLARSALMPSINASGTLAQQRDNLSGETITGDSNQIELNLSMPVYDKPILVAVKQAKHQHKAAEMEFKIAEQSLILRVADAYFAVLAAKDNHEVARLHKISIGRQMDLSRERLDVGLGTRTDLYDARARYQQADSDLISTGDQIQNTLQQLREITGTDVSELAKLGKSAPLEKPAPDSVEKWIDLSLKNNLSMAIQMENENIAELEVNRQKTKRWPSLSANINNSWRDSDNAAAGENAGDQQVFTASLVLNVPVYLGGSINLGARQANFNFGATGQETESLRRQTRSVTTSAYLAVSSGISQVKALQEAVKAGRSALKAKEEGFSAGLTTNLDVLDAQRDLSRFKTDYLAARYNYILAVLRLDEVVGNLSEADMKRVNGWLQQ